MAREFFGCGPAGCRWDDSPLGPHNSGLAGGMGVLFFALLFSEIIPVLDQGCPMTFWRNVIIFQILLSICILVRMVHTRMRRVCLEILKDSSLIEAFAAAFYLGAVACTHLLPNEVDKPAWCGKHWFEGAGILLAFGTALAALAGLFYACADRWRAARAAVAGIAAPAAPHAPQTEAPDQESHIGHSQSRQQSASSQPEQELSRSQPPV